MLINRTPATNRVCPVEAREVRTIFQRTHKPDRCPSDTLNTIEVAGAVVGKDYTQEVRALRPELERLAGLISLTSKQPLRRA